MMTNLPDTSTEQGQREASVMLARLMPDWQVVVDHNIIWIDIPGESYRIRDEFTLYHPAFMALAWRVLNWALDKFQQIEKGLLPHSNMPFTYDMKWRQSVVGKATLERALFTMPPAEAQHAWLDKILELANEAGMLEAVRKGE